MQPKNLGFKNSECGNSKCYYNIDACSFNNTNCAVITTKLNAAKNGLDISLSHSGNDTWVAIGITPNEVMENTDIYYCQNRGKFSKTHSSFECEDGSHQFDLYNIAEISG